MEEEKKKKLDVDTQSLYEEYEFEGDFITEVRLDLEEE